MSLQPTLPSITFDLPDPISPTSSSTYDSNDSSPPHLHTRYLSNVQQAQCQLNPTYRKGLDIVRRLRDKIQLRRSEIHAHEIAASPEFTGKVRKRQGSWKSSDEGKEEVRELVEEERVLKIWDDQLAQLAEGLVERPQFHVNDEVHYINGRWLWEIPRALTVDQDDRTPEALRRFRIYIRGDTDELFRGKAEPRYEQAVAKVFTRRKAKDEK